MRNERGYTLVITLLMITLIFIVSATLIANSVNSAKQNKLTGSTYLATQIAEMGVKYVEEKLKAEFEVNEDLSDNLDDIVDSILINETPNKIDNEHRERTFEIKNMGVETDEDDSNITKTLSFTSIGSVENGKTKDLTATIQIVILKESEEDGTIIPGESGLSLEPKNGGTHGWIEFQPNKEYVFNGDSTFGSSLQPKNPSVITILGTSTHTKNVELAENVIFQAMNLMIPKNQFHMKKNSQLKVCNDAEIQNLEFGGENIKVTICNDATFTGHPQITKNNSTVEIRGNATFEDATSLTNSSLVIGKDLSFKEKNATINNSTIKVFGNMYLGTTMELYNNSNIFIHGNLILTKTSKLSQNGFIQVNGDLKINDNPSEWEIDGNRICVKGKVDRLPNNLTIQHSDATSCNSFLSSGVYEMPNLQINNDRSNYFIDCTETCRLSDLPGASSPEGINIGIDEVIYH